MAPKDKIVFTALATETHSGDLVGEEQNDRYLFVSVFQEPAEMERNIVRSAKCCFCALETLPRSCSTC